MASRKNPAVVSMTDIAIMPKDADSARRILQSIRRSFVDGVDYRLKAGMALILAPTMMKLAVRNYANMQPQHLVALVRRKVNDEPNRQWTNLSTRLGLPDDRLALYRLVHNAWRFMNAADKTTQAGAEAEERAEASA